MSAIRLVEIGVKLGELYQSKAAAALQEWQCSQDADRRKVELIPAEGWPGKNDKERDAAREKAFLADETLQKILAEMRVAKNEAFVIDADLQALEAERRALEWGVRSQMVSALSKARVDANGRGDPAGDRAFDDAGQSQLDQAWSESVEDESHEDQAEDAIYNDIPF